MNVVPIPIPSYIVLSISHAYQVGLRNAIYPSYSIMEECGR